MTLEEKEIASILFRAPNWGKIGKLVQLLIFIRQSWRSVL